MIFDDQFDMYIINLCINDEFSSIESIVSLM